MFSRSAHLYDLIYTSKKDYAAESRRLAEHVRTLRPDARTLLDVGCGTGEHARWLTGEGFEVEGVDLDEGLLARAREKNPHVPFHAGDMRSVRLGRRFDVVTCLFSAIGYVGDAEGLAAAMDTFRAHVPAGGLVVVEPWLTPDVIQDGRVDALVAEGEGVTVCRMSRIRRDGRVSRLDFHYLVGTPQGIEHATEVHEAALFTRAEMEAAFDAAGFSRVDFDEEGLMGRGLYTAHA